MADTKTLEAEGTSIALEWIAKAQDSINGFQYCWSHGITGPFYPVIRNAFATHFQLVVDSATALPNQKVVDAAFLTFIRNNYRTVKEVLGKTGTYFKFPTSASVPSANKNDMIYTYGGMTGSIHFNPDAFIDYDPVTGKGYGPRARAAMVLHEAVHIADTLSGPPNHIYEHQPGYATQTANQAVHNASSYASFAQHVTYGKDTRYGGDPARLDRRSH